MKISANREAAQKYILENIEETADYDQSYDKAGLRGTTCWMWMKAWSTKGYGRTWFGGRLTAVHRVAYWAFIGPVPEDHHVLHKCDNRWCCCPDHLFIGTTQDNTDDMMTKGRFIAKLTEADVREVRRMLAEGVARQTIADHFGVSEAAIRDIDTGKTWGWLKTEDPPVE